MKPVTQTQFSFVIGPEAGNCFAACIASILELELEAVPNFVEADDWRSACIEWLRRRGLGYVALDLNKHAKLYIGNALAGLYCILDGPSPRSPGHYHSVVGRIGEHAGEVGIELVHDPHPDREYFGSQEPTAAGFLVHFPTEWGLR